MTVIDTHGKMTEAAGKDFFGLDRFEAREVVVARLEKDNLLSKTEDYQLELSRCQRCNEIVEPLLSKQWFVHIHDLAQPAIQAVKDGRTVFIPNQWEKTYFDWMYNIRDWCISRQLWWGHRIPAWFCECGEIIVARQDPEQCPLCKSNNLRQDEDVLDTWFSSALWPFSTLGWPDNTALLKKYYPTTLMETGFDILFFWVARMLMMGLKFMGDVPFRTVYLHAMVRDAQGQKMSKTKGNVIDPLDVTKSSGADALRFTLAIMTAQGRDIKMSLERVEGYKHFINKIWNASRFALMNLEDLDETRGEGEIPETLFNKWMLARTRQVIEAVDTALSGYRFNDAANTLYNFFWHEFCDWYLELIKPSLSGKDGPQVKAESQQVLVRVLDTALRLLHPFTPFVTEEIWQKLPLKKRSSEFLATAKWPEADAFPQDPEALEAMGGIMTVIGGIRNIRGESNIPPGKPLKAHVFCQSELVRKTLALQKDTLMHLARLEQLVLETTEERPRPSAIYVGENLEICVPLKGVIDFDAEQQRLQKEIEKQNLELKKAEAKLSNQDFLKQAPKAVVEKETAKQADAQGRLSKLNQALEQIQKWSQA